MRRIFRGIVILLALIGLAAVGSPVANRALFWNEWDYYYALKKIVSIKSFGISVYEGKITTAIWLADGGYFKLGGAGKLTMEKADRSLVYELGPWDLRCVYSESAQYGYGWPTLYGLSEAIGRPDSLSIAGLVADYDKVEAALALWPQESGTNRIKFDGANDCWVTKVTPPIQYSFIERNGFGGGGWLYFRDDTNN